MVKTKMQNLWMILRELYIETLHPRFNAVTVIAAVIFSAIAYEVADVLVIVMNASDNAWESVLIRLAVGLVASILWLLVDTVSIRHYNKILAEESNNA